jgi:hypothetical protein
VSSNSDNIKRGLCAYSSSTITYEWFLLFKVAVTDTQCVFEYYNYCSRVCCTRGVVLRYHFPGLFLAVPLCNAYTRKLFCAPIFFCSMMAAFQGAAWVHSYLLMCISLSMCPFVSAVQLFLFCSLFLSIHDLYDIDLADCLLLLLHCITVWHDVLT